MHEWLKGEVSAFKKFWSGELYLDVNKDMYRAMGNGKLLKQSWWTFFCNMCTVFKKFDVEEKGILPEGSSTKVCVCMCVRAYAPARMCKRQDVYS